MLVFATQYTAQESVIGEIAAKIFKSSEICFADRISCQPDCRIDLIAHSDHQGQGDVVLAARGQYGVLQKACTGAFFGKLERIRQGLGHIDRLHTLAPVSEKTPYFSGGFCGNLKFYVVALRLQDTPVLRPLV